MRVCVCVLQTSALGTWRMVLAGSRHGLRSTSPWIWSIVHLLIQANVCLSGTRCACWFTVGSRWTSYRRLGCITPRSTPIIPPSSWTGRGRTSFSTGPMVGVLGLGFPRCRTIFYDSSISSLITIDSFECLLHIGHREYLVGLKSDHSVCAVE